MFSLPVSLLPSYTGVKRVILMLLLHATPEVRMGPPQFFTITINTTHNPGHETRTSTVMSQYPWEEAIAVASGHRGGDKKDARITTRWEKRMRVYRWRQYCQDSASAECLLKPSDDGVGAKNIDILLSSLAEAQFENKTKRENVCRMSKDLPRGWISDSVEKSVSTIAS